MIIKIYGTHHLLEKQKVVDAIEEFNPDAVCVELDQTRFDKLQGKNVEQQIEGMSWFSKKIMKKIKDKSEKVVKNTSQQYGGDMISALQYCTDKNIPCKLIDMDVKDIAKGFDKLNWGEKVLIYFGVGFQSPSLDQVNNLTEEQIEANLQNLKIKLPNLYNHVVVARDKYMANRIMDVVKLDKYNRIQVFVGKGHVKGIKQFLDDAGFDSE
jgi:pheromone shutdown protein TraB